MQNNKSCKTNIYTPSALVGGLGGADNVKGVQQTVPTCLFNIVFIATSTLFTMVTLSCQRVTLQPRPTVVVVMRMVTNMVMKMVIGHFWPWPLKVTEISPASDSWTLENVCILPRWNVLFVFFLLEAQYQCGHYCFCSGSSVGLLWCLVIVSVWAVGLH